VKGDTLILLAAIGVGGYLAYKAFTGLKAGAQAVGEAATNAYNYVANPTAFVQGQSPSVLPAGGFQFPDGSIITLAQLTQGSGSAQGQVVSYADGSAKLLFGGQLYDIGARNSAGNWPVTPNTSVAASAGASPLNLQTDFGVDTSDWN